MIPHRLPLKSGDEQDALSRRAKGYLRWRPGERKAIKRGYQRRMRQIAREALRK